MGAAAGAALSGLLLDTDIFAADVGWRLAFFLGAALGIGIMLVRRYVPESPRWLMIHRRPQEAERLVAAIEEEVKERADIRELPEPKDSIEVAQRDHTGFVEVARTLLRRYPRRSFLGFVLLATQAFVYNAVIFTFSLVLTSVFKVDSSVAGLYLVPFGIANFLGALLLGRLFDTVGRKPMIAGTYFVAAIGLAIVAALLEGRLAEHVGLRRPAVRHVLRRVRGRLGRLSDGVRDVPAGDPRDGDRALLRDLHGHRRRGRPAAVRQAARRRRPDGRRARLLDRRRADGRSPRSR